ncbi:MAG: hypothetical protein D6712_21760, partial [Chloroflexi bacterium]
ALWPLLCLIRALLHLMRTPSPSKRQYAMAIAWFVLSAGMVGSSVVYTLFPLMVWFIGLQLWRRQWGKVGRTLFISIAGSVIAAFLLIPMALEAINTPAIGQSGGSVRFSIDLLGLVSPSFFHPLWGNLLQYPRQVIGTNITEGLSYLGLLPVVLALIALWRFRSVRSWAVLGLLAWVLALGPLLKVFDTPVIVNREGYTTFIPLPFLALQSLPFAELARSAGRFMLVVGVALAIMAAYGLDVVLQWRPQHRRAVVILLAALILFDYQSYWPFPTRPADVPSAIAQLAEREDIRAVFNAPWDSLAGRQGLYFQTVHHKPIIAGQTVRETPVNHARLWLLEQFDPALLDVAGVDVVIIYKAYASEALLARAQEKLGVPAYEDADFILYFPPDPQQPPSFQFIAPQNLRTADSIPTYLYVPTPQWVDFSIEVQSEY